MVKTGALVDQVLETSDPSLELHSRVNVNLLAMFDIIHFVQKRKSVVIRVNRVSLFVTSLVA